MKEQKEKVALLKKVHLSLEAGKTLDSMDLTPSPIRFDFIFGLGTGGLTPFEYELAEKEVGETIALSISKGRIPDMFGHLWPYLPSFPGDVEILYLKVHLIGLSSADQREIIKALAESAEMGDHICDGC
jgi:hypothetical protein